MAHQDLHFDINPAVVLRLGEELVTDEFSALLEAAKNSYDAGAKRVIIEIDTTTSPPSSTFFTGGEGFVSIRDDGGGMSLTDISEGWLVLASSRKRSSKKENISPTQRVPLGDKGIGRLGLQRLGDFVEIFTRAKESKTTIHIGFNWNQFRTAEKLSQVEVRREEILDNRKHGTEIIVSSLHEPELWQSDSGSTRLQAKLSQLVSPFPDLTELRLYVKLQGESVDIGAVSHDVLSVAQLKYSFAFDGVNFDITGAYTLEYLLRSGSDIGDVRDKVMADRGRSLYDALTQSDSRRDLEYLPTGPHVILSKRRLSVESLGGYDTSEAANPGPFKGEIFHFSRSDSELPSSFDRTSELRRFLEAQSGIRIYRNGFAVRPYGIDGDDWLALGKSWTSGSSYYGLRPANTLGYVAITARDNRNLQERTDREGFIDNAASRNFFRLVKEVTHHANATNAAIRRGLVKFSKPISMDSGFIQALTQSGADQEFGRATLAAGSLVRVASDLPGGPKANKKIFEEAMAAAKTLESTAQLGVALSAETRRLREELELLLELAALGLTTEALSHEIANVLDGLTSRTNSLAQHISRVHSPDDRVVAYVETVRSSISAIRKQLSHITPALRFARERREPIDMHKFLDDLKEFYQSRLAARGIEMAIERRSQSFRVRANRGKLIQILDNLILNSEYWVLESLRRKLRRRGRIELIEDSPSLILSDNGLGIDPSIETSIFEPFVSTKRGGRGLGLYIVRQLLDSLGCSIVLRPERNKSGRRYSFEINLETIREK